ncbi:flagellar type III secretion system pore protein FliP [Solilutibacter silvestris]|uniref:flagellar type III secretion system pore protein FliP n=1 Tax=Solilutibacter silvestris TaxID=1645665 RepID=UPI003D3296AD
MARNCKLVPWIIGLLLLAVVPSVWALPSDLTDQIAKQDLAQPLRTVLVLTLLSIIPILLISMTSFTRIVIVLSLLRHALGLPQAPPNSVIIALSICLTFFAMAPVADSVNQTALTPYLEKKIEAKEALAKARIPVADFMLRQTHESDLRAVLDMSHQPMPKTKADLQFSTLVPAFMLSELKTAFQIGFIIFLPFLVIDLVVSAILMGLGMIMLPPTTISLPIKLLLFVLIDGWVLISRALLSGIWN